MFGALAIDAAMVAKRDRASDIVLDASGFVVEGGPLDKLHCTWAHVRSCNVAPGEPRTAVRWLILSWLTARQFDSINARTRVRVMELKLSRDGNKDLVLAEGEGDEIDSLEQLRDSIRGAAKPPHEPPPLPQEILRCPHCSAPLVPAATPRMTCTYCHRDLDVPAELQQRVRASIELDSTSRGRATAVKTLVDQPSARRAAVVIAACRRLMIWIQPVAFGLWIALNVHQSHHVEHPGGISVTRLAPSDDYAFFYDLAVTALLIAAAFAIAWSIGHAYIANRQALRMLADNFGAVPPVTPGTPSTCRTCNAPLPATTALLVHCVYCTTENVLGVDPRPAAMRRARERIDLARGLRRRRFATLRRWIAIPAGILLAVAMVREVRIAWRVPDAEDSHEYLAGHIYCSGTCGDVTNSDGLRRTFTIIADGARVETTVLPHGQTRWECTHGCTIEVDGRRVTPKNGEANELFIEHGALAP